ncbi:MAG TPA: molecular chaperone DnaJ [Rikenellaceae bacterium]|nr:molecular chaperone DnaJ [Rikenellaceae bacterium]
MLGLTKGASADDIKGAYRKAALKWHPDRWVNGTDAEKKTAEEKFKEASEAYSVLSDPDKKAKYDQFGFAGVDGAAGSQDWGQGFSSLNDLLNNLFGGFGGSGFEGFGGFSGFGGGRTSQGGRQGRGTIRGNDVYVTLRLTLEEIATGCTKDIEVERQRPCKACGGRGTQNASDIKTCPTCNGSGQVQHVSNFLFTRSVSYDVCPNCGGTGKVVMNPCSSCHGTGLTRVKDTLRVNIPAGVETGMQIPVRGEGDTGRNGGVNGDLYVQIEQIPHARLKIDGGNLFYTRVISVADAMLGCEIDIPCLDGTQKMKLPAGTQSGTVERLRGKGMPSVNGYGKGDLYVKILVWIPHKLSRSEKEAIENMRDSSSFKPDPTRDDRVLFEKESKYF